MGQVNSQDCEFLSFSFTNDKQTIIYNENLPRQNNQNNQQKKIEKQKKLPRINVLSRENNYYLNNLQKHRNSYELKDNEIKYITQSTVADVQDIMKSSIFYKTNKNQQCCIILKSQNQKFKIQIQKNKSKFIGTSLNCNFQMKKHLIQFCNEIQGIDKNNSVENTFKIQATYAQNNLKIKDMGVGVGSFIKVSQYNLSHLFKVSDEMLKSYQLSRYQKEPLNYNKEKNKLFKRTLFIDQTFINIKITQNHQNILSEGYIITLEELGEQNFQIYQVKTLDIDYINGLVFTFITNQLKQIVFKISKDRYFDILLEFQHSECQQYLKERTQISQGDMLRLGFIMFKVQNIIFNNKTPNIEASSLITIQDQ